MDLRQLAALVAVAEHGTFSAAARALHTVQSNVSTHVARLEKELGATLVDRASGQLTDEGRAVLERGSAHPGRARRPQRRHRLDGRRRGGHRRVGVIGTVGRWLVPRLVDAVHRDHPLVRPVVLDAVTSSLVPQVLDGVVDFAIINLPLDTPDLLVEPLFGEDRVIVAPSSHPLAARPHRVARPRPPSTTCCSRRRARRSATSSTWWPPHRGRAAAQAEVDGMRLLASLAFQGFGAAIIPSGAAPSYVGGEWTIVAVDELAPRSVGSSGEPARCCRARPRAREAVIDVVAEQLAVRAGIHPVEGGPRPDPA
jgi:DNA-binding transcriptional LysR family regulator